MSNPIPITDLDAAAAAEAIQERGERDAHLDEAKAVLLDALDKLGITRVEAEITIADDKPLIASITAFTEGQDVRDLADTGPFDFGWGENHQSYDCLRDFARDYLSAVLLHQPAEHLTAGTLYVRVPTCAVVQPIDYVARDAVRTKEKVERLHADKTHIVAALKALGVVLVEVEYDGEGDSGQIDTITAYKADETRVDVAGVSPFVLGDGPAAERFNTLHECLDTFAWDVLWHHHEGFENNDGGFGKIVIDVDDGTVRIEHNWRISSSEYTEAEF
jgi:hypothetical protein